MTARIFFSKMILILTTIAAATIFHQTWLVYKAGDHQEISIPFVCFSLLIVLTWVAYGLIIDDFPIIYSSGIQSIAFASLLILIFLQCNSSTDRIQHLT